MTLDGFCNHEAGIADDELHEHYNAMLRDAGALIYGRITYQLMESYWPLVVKNPSGNKSTDDFAVLIDNVQKIVFSRTLKSVSWKNARLEKELTKGIIQELKEEKGKDIFAGSPGMIAALTEMDLIDEYHLCIHPLILGKGLVLFKDISRQVDLRLQKTKTFGSGAVVLYYAQQKKG